MKPLAKAALIGVITLTVGCGVYAVAAGIAYANRDETKTSNREEAQYVLKNETVTGIDVELVADSIVVRTGDVTNITIDYKDNKEAPIFDISVVNGVLTMKEKIVNPTEWFTFKWPWEWFNIQKDLTTTITIPNSLDLSYVLYSTSGAISASGITSTSSFTATSTSGSVCLQNSDIDGAVTLSSTSSAVTANVVISKDDVSLTSISGSANAKGVSTTKNIKVGSTSGAANAENVACNSINGSSVSGSVNLDRVTFDSKIKANSTSGSVSIKVVGDEAYKVTHSSVSGTINVGVRTDPEATKSIEASSVSGSINIQYAA